jgi:hypothetical protein
MATALRAPLLFFCIPVPKLDGFAYDSWFHTCAYYLGVKDISKSVLADYRRHETNATTKNVLNTAHNVSRTRLICRQLRKDLAQQLLRDIEMLSVFSDRLGERGESLVADGTLGRRSLLSASHRIGIDLRHAKERLQLLRLPRQSRLLVILLRSIRRQNRNRRWIKSMIKVLVSPLFVSKSAYNSNHG